MRTTKFMSLVMVLALTASACGGSNDQESAPSSSGEAKALQERVEKLEREATRREADAARELTQARRKARAAERKAGEARRKRAQAREDAAQTSAPRGAESEASGDIVVPNVTGMDHQAAQDVMQGEGLWLLDEEDCTGQGRMLLFDRNWEVISTDPLAGTRVSEDTTITLCSKKEDE